MIGTRRALRFAGAALILAYFFFFTWKSLSIRFDSDDMYGLYFAWSRPLGEVLGANVFFWNGFFRPLGALFYRAIFAVAGFDPLPFHVAYLLFGVCNIALCYWFLKLVSRSERISALGALLFAFHSRLMEVWFRTGVIYDVLCFAFLNLAACLYVAARREGGKLTGARIAAVLFCYLCALDAKEMAVFLPVLLLSYELVINRARLQSLVQARAAAVIAVMAVVTVPYAYGKLHGPNAIANNPVYKPEYSYARFADTWAVYLGHLFVRDHALPHSTAIATLAALAILALLLRSRLALFAWTIIVFGMLPVSFSPARGAFVMLISWPGWVLYAAALLVALQDFLTRGYPRYRTALACVVFLLAGWRMGKLNLHDQRADPRPWLYDEPRDIRALASQMWQQHPSMPRGGSVLFVSDPFGADEYTPLFVLRLLYHDRDLTVDRVKMMNPPPANWDRYQFVYAYEGQRYRQLK